MNRHDEILNELVYQIDDLVYDFYSKSNEIIAKKNNQDRLLNFRDKTVETLNNMNVRSLEMISGLKKQEHITLRADALLRKNKDLIASSYEVLNNANDKSELLEDLGTLSASMYDSAKQVVNKVEESGVVNKFLNKTKEGFDSIVKHPSFVKGTEVVKETTKDALEAGSKALKQGSDKVAEWLDDAKEDVETLKDDVHEFSLEADETLSDAEDQLHILIDDTFETADEVKDKAVEKADDLKDKAEETVDHLEDKVEEKTEDLEESIDEVENRVEDHVEEYIHVDFLDKEALPQTAIDSDISDAHKEEVEDEKSNNL